MTGRNRAGYADVGARTRQAVATAGAADPPAAAMRALMGVVVHLTSYSRTADTVSRAQLAEAVGCSEKTISRGLDWLSEHGVIDYIAGGSLRGGTRTVSRIALPAVRTRDTVVPGTGVDPVPSTGDDPVSGHDTGPGTGWGPTRDRNGTGLGTHAVPLPRSTEKTSERRTPDTIRAEATRIAEDERARGKQIVNFPSYVDRIERRLRDEHAAATDAAEAARARATAETRAAVDKRNAEEAAALTPEQNLDRLRNLRIGTHL